MDQIDKGWLIEQAAAITRDDVQRLLDNVQGVLEEMGEVNELQELKADVKNAISMIQEYHDGNFDGVSWEKVAGLTYSILYLLDPGDGIPDNVPGIGFLDDFAILVLGLEMVQDEMDHFREWTKEHLKENYHL